MTRISDSVLKFFRLCRPISDPKGGTSAAGTFFFFFFTIAACTSIHRGRARPRFQITSVGPKATADDDDDDEAMEQFTTTTTTIYTCVCHLVWSFAEDLDCDHGAAVSAAGPVRSAFPRRLHLSNHSVYFYIGVFVSVAQKQDAPVLCVSPSSADPCSYFMHANGAKHSAPRRRCTSALPYSSGTRERESEREGKEKKKKSIGERKKNLGQLNYGASECMARRLP